LRARIRKATAQDVNFIRSSWLNVWTYSSGLSRPHTQGGMRRLLDRLLQNPRTVVQVAAEEANDAELLGYVVLTGDLLHMALTKRGHRRTGVCRALLSEAPREMRAWWPSPDLRHVGKCVAIALDPLALLEL
jgi:hypothetical protein